MTAARWRSACRRGRSAQPGARATTRTGAKGTIRRRLLAGRRRLAARAPGSPSPIWGRWRPRPRRRSRRCVRTCPMRGPARRHLARPAACRTGSRARQARIAGDRRAHRADRGSARPARRRRRPGHRARRPPGGALLAGLGRRAPHLPARRRFGFGQSGDIPDLHAACGIDAAAIIDAAARAAIRRFRPPAP